MKCTYCQTVNDGSKFHPGTCANCGAVFSNSGGFGGLPYYMSGVV